MREHLSESEFFHLFSFAHGAEAGSRRDVGCSTPLTYYRPTPYISGGTAKTVQVQRGILPCVVAILIQRLSECDGQSDKIRRPTQGLDTLENLTENCSENARKSKADNVIHHRSDALSAWPRGPCCWMQKTPSRFSAGRLSPSGTHASGYQTHEA